MCVSRHVDNDGPTLAAEWDAIAPRLAAAAQHAIVPADDQMAVAVADLVVQHPSGAVESVERTGRVCVERGVPPARGSPPARGAYRVERVARRVARGLRPHAVVEHVDD